MSCFNPGGNPPQPPRVWSRVQGPCSTEQPDSASPVVYFPLTKQTIPIQEAANEFRMIEKGNVLQYKKNSSNLTKKQRYTQIARGKWVYRNPTLATQSDTYTNPNTRNLTRVDYTTIYADDGTDANLPVTEPEPTIISIPSKLPPRAGTRPVPPPPLPPPVNPNVRPNTQLDPNYPPLCPQYIDPSYDPNPDPVIETPDTLPPVAVNKWPAMTLPYVDPSPPEKERVVIADGGSFVVPPSNQCALTSASDVPGPIQTLCYNSGKLGTFYPRQRRKMGNSGDKFPTGYKFKNPST